MLPTTFRLLASRSAPALLLVTLVGLLTQPMLAQQTGTVSGVVTRVQTGRPISGAEVVLSGIPLRTRTNDDGAYLLSNVPPGRYDIEISYRGLGAVLVSVEVSVDTAAVVNVSLDIETYSLGTIVVEAASRAPDLIRS